MTRTQSLPASLRPLGFGLGLLVLAGCSASVPPPLPESRSDRECLAELTRLGVQYQVEPQASSTSRSCRIQNPILVSAATIPFSRPATASCAFVLKFDRFEREVVRPLAKREFGHDLKTIIHLGAYSCRSTRSGRESEHAVGRAMDIAGFELTDGTVISVKEDWGRRGRGRDFLRAVVGQACHYFNEVLDPDSDRDHVDHIHLDLGHYKLCVHR